MASQHSFHGRSGDGSRILRAAAAPYSRLPGVVGGAVIGLQPANDNRRPLGERVRAAIIGLSLAAVLLGVAYFQLR